MKECARCHVVKDVAEFYALTSGRPMSWCKGCVTQHGQDTQRRVKLEAIEYKGGVCLDCGQMPHQAAMTFHHRDPLEKDFAISRGRGSSFTAIKDELDKCDLLCLNCHAIRHWKGE